ncbi:MAG TPA: hypothetical protein PKJ63_00645 [Cyclobacteriaceae bacterium]|nr:hypothetical protein [Cyclobacteriaceae bacterium]
MSRLVVSEIIRYLLIILFAYTAASKMLTYPLFVVQLGLSPLLPPFVQPVGWLIPLTEFLVALMLAIPGMRLAGLYASWALMFLFTLYVTTILTVASHVPCSCGGVLEAMTWEQHLVFNVVVFALNSLVLVWHYRDQRMVAVS